MDIVSKTTLTLPYSVNGYAGKGKLLLGVESVDGGNKVFMTDLYSGTKLASTQKFEDENTTRAVYTSLNKNFTYAWMKSSEISSKLYDIKELLKNDKKEVDMASSVFDSKIPIVIVFSNLKVPLSILVSEGFKSLFNRCVNDAISNANIK